MAWWQREECFHSLRSGGMQIEDVFGTCRGSTNYRVTVLGNILSASVLLPSYFIYTLFSLLSCAVPYEKIRTFLFSSFSFLLLCAVIGRPLGGPMLTKQWLLESSFFFSDFFSRGVVP